MQKTRQGFQKDYAREGANYKCEPWLETWDTKLGYGALDTTPKLRVYAAKPAKVHLTFVFFF